MTLWKGRIDANMSAVMKRLGNSLSVDIALLPYDCKLNEVWAEELERLGIIDEDELQDIKKELSIILKDLNTGKLDANTEDEDVHSLVERLLTERLGDAGKKIHAGKSRNDQVVTDLMLYLKDNVPHLSLTLKKLMSALLALSEKNIDLIMPGYTHMQQAQPISAAHYLMSFAFSLYDDLKRLDAYAINNLEFSPIGAGALAGTTLDVDREKIAKKLGFKFAAKNSLKTVSDRAFVIELASIISIISMHLSRYAEDMIVWASKEFGFIKLSGAVTTGSSMMPQKKNPDSLELIRGMTGTIYGNLVGLLTITKGLPLSYSKDLQDDKRFIFSSIRSITDAVSLFTEVIEGVEFCPENIKKHLSDDVLATDIATMMAVKGKPFREAYETVAGAVKRSLAGESSLKDLLAGDLDGMGLMGMKFTLEESINRRDRVGGTAPSAVKEQIKYLSSKIS